MPKSECTGLHKLLVLSGDRRGAMMQYRYMCLECGKWLKIQSGIIVARTDAEAKAYAARRVLTLAKATSKKEPAGA